MDADRQILALIAELYANLAGAINQVKVLEAENQSLRQPAEPPPTSR